MRSNDCFEDLDASVASLGRFLSHFGSQLENGMVEAHPNSLLEKRSRTILHYTFRFLPKFFSLSIPNSIVVGINKRKSNLNCLIDNITKCYISFKNNFASTMVNKIVLNN